MSSSVFFDLVQLRAKTASVFPFLIGTLFAYYHYRSIQLIYLLIFFVAMVLFNMAVDTHDNYLDYLNIGKYKLNPELLRVNVIAENHLSIKLVNTIIYGFITISAALGIFVASKTGWPVLWLGMFSFFIGYYYQGGPFPISHTPVGEFFSGFTMGSVIVILAVYINVYDKVTFNWAFVWPILLASGLSAACVANILLANNICDRDEDIAIGRKTIVSYIGIPNSIRYLKAIYIFGFICQIAAILMAYLPWTCAIVFAFLPQMIKKVQIFSNHPDKKETFIQIITTLAALLSLQVLGLAVGLFL